MVSSAGLVKALGGGWDVAQMNREDGGVAAPAPAPAEGASAPQAAAGPAPVAQKGAAAGEVRND